MKRPPFRMWYYRLGTAVHSCLFLKYALWNNSVGASVFFAVAMIWNIAKVHQWSQYKKSHSYYS